jgi:hypothetical protein
VHASSPDARPLTTSSGFRDGLGERVLAFDRATGELRERLRVRPELGAFESALGEQIDRVSELTDPRFPRASDVDRDRGTGQVVVVSTFAPGERLSELLQNAAERGLFPDITAGLQTAGELLLALTSFQGATGLTHGAIAPSRVVISDDGEILLTDFIYAPLLARLRFSQARLWRELGVIAAADGSAFDQASDVRQVALVLLSMVLGRPLDRGDVPPEPATLVAEVADVALISGGESLATPLRAWLQRALTIEGEQPFDNVAQACASFGQLMFDGGGLAGSRAALTGFLEEVRRPLSPDEIPLPIQPIAARAVAPPPPPAPIVVEAEPVVIEPAPLAIEPIAVEPEPILIKPEPIVVQPEPPPLEPEPLPIEPEPIVVRAEPVPPAWAPAPPVPLEPQPFVIPPEPEPARMFEAAPELEGMTEPAPAIVPPEAQPEPAQPVARQSFFERIFKKKIVPPSAPVAQPSAPVQPVPSGEPTYVSVAPDLDLTEVIDAAARPRPEAFEFDVRNLRELPSPEPKAQQPRFTPVPVVEPPPMAAFSPAPVEPVAPVAPVAPITPATPSGRSEWEVEEPEPPLAKPEKRKKLKLKKKLKRREVEAPEPVFKQPVEPVAPFEPDFPAVAPPIAPVQVPVPPPPVVDVAPPLVEMVPPAPLPPLPPPAPRAHRPIGAEPGPFLDITPPGVMPLPPPMPVITPGSQPITSPIGVWQPPMAPPAPLPSSGPIRLKEMPDSAPGRHRRGDSGQRSFGRDSLARDIGYAEARRVEGHITIPRPSAGAFGVAWKIAAAVVALVAIGFAATRMEWVKPAADPGVLIVESTPAGSEVYVDGTLKGKTPVTVGVTAGAHQVKLTRRGLTHSVSVQIEPGKQHVERITWSKIRPIGGLHVESQPPGAKVFVDGKLVGETPLDLPNIAVGRHTVTLQGSGGTVRRTVRVTAAEEEILSVDLYSGFLRVDSPIELELFEGGRSLGTSGSEQILLTAGSHSVVAVSEALGYRETHHIEMPPGETKTLTIAPTAGVNINAQPWAEVWIDGAKVGETPIANRRVPIGTREFVFRHPELGERKVIATVKYGETTQVTIDMNQP